MEQEIEELEKIQDEIMKTGKWREVSEVPNMYVIDCLNIIEHRIKKLKGENNGHNTLKGINNDKRRNNNGITEYCRFNQTRWERLGR